MFVPRSQEPSALTMSLIINFTHADGTVESVGIGGGFNTTPQYSNGLGGVITQPVYAVPAGYTPIQSTLSSGSPAWVISGDAGYYIRFFSGANKSLMPTKLRMDDANALEAARIAIDTALAAGDAVINLLSDGSVGS